MNMEKRIRQVEPGLFHVTSEPGDGTRYDYFVHKAGDDYSFMPGDNTFRYPQRLNYWELGDRINESFPDKEEYLTQAEIYGCNPYTLMECVRTIKEVHWKS